MTRHQRRIAGTARKDRSVCAIALAVAVVLGAAGCGDSGDGGHASPDPEPSTETKKPAASEDPEEEKKKQVRAAYTSFWKEQVKAYAKSSTKGTKVEDYATGQALSQLESDVARMKARGDKNKGAPGHDFDVALTPKQNGKVGAAVITDCLDISKWKTVSRKTGEVYPLPKEQPRRAVTTVKAEDWGKQGWMIIEVKVSTTEC